MDSPDSKSRSRSLPPEALKNVSTSASDEPPKSPKPNKLSAAKDKINAIRSSIRRDVEGLKRVTNIKRSKVEGVKESTEDVDSKWGEAANKSSKKTKKTKNVTAATSVDDVKPEDVPLPDDTGVTWKKIKKSKRDKVKTQSESSPEKSRTIKPSAFVRKLNIGKYKSSVQPVVKLPDVDSDLSVSSGATPTSVKRHTPEGDDFNLVDKSISEISLTDVDEIESKQSIVKVCVEGTSSLSSDKAESVDSSTSSSTTAAATVPPVESVSSKRVSASATVVSNPADSVQHRVPVAHSTLPYAISTWKNSETSGSNLKSLHWSPPSEATRRRIAYDKQPTVESIDESSAEISYGNLDTKVSFDISDELKQNPSDAFAKQAFSLTSYFDKNKPEEGTLLPGIKEDRKESVEEYKGSETTIDTHGMPAFGDLIIDVPQRVESSNMSSLNEATDGRREHLYKILVIGELGTGKTSIIKRYVHQFFSQHYRATIGVDFALKVLNWDANTIIRLQLWDIAGQERFGNMTRVYYKEAVGAFIVFDVTRVATFDAVVKWKQDLDSKVQLADGSPIPCVLLANKCDQQKEGLINTPAKMDEYCKEKGFAGWFETSAKENINIEEAARSLVQKILLNDKLIHGNDAKKDNDCIALDGKNQNGDKISSGSKTCSC